MIFFSMIVLKNSIEYLVQTVQRYWFKYDRKINSDKSEIK